MDIDMNTLRAFLEIADRGNLTEGARALHMSQSALSTLMRGLEGEVGKELFLRSGNKALRLSEEGKIFAEAAKRILLQSDFGEDVLRRAETVRGEIHIGVQNASSSLINLLADLHKAFPQVAFRLHRRHGPLEEYLSSDLDFYALPETMKGDLPNLRIAAMMALYAIVSEDHPLARRRVLRLEELTRERFAFALHSNGKPEDTYQYCLDAGLKPDVAVLCGDVGLHLELARQAGMMLITYNTLRGFRRGLKGLVEIPIDYKGVQTIPIVLAWPHDIKNPMAARIAKYLLETYPDGYGAPT